jgi:hypothetical protein
VTRRLQNRDIDEPIERLVRKFCAEHGIAAIHVRDLVAPLKDHVDEILGRYAEGFWF